MTLTLVSLETVGVEGLASRQIGFNARGLSLVRSSVGVRRAAFLQTLALALGGPNSGSLTPLLQAADSQFRLSVTAGSVYELQLQNTQPQYQLIFQPKGEREVYASGEALLEALGKATSLAAWKVPFLPSLKVEPLIFPAELNAHRRKDKSHKARRRRELLHALNAPPRRRVQRSQRLHEARQRVTETAVSDPLADLEAYQQLWEEHVKQIQRIEHLEHDLHSLEGDLTRADTLHGSIVRDYGGLHRLSPGVLADLPALARDRTDRAEAEARQQKLDADHQVIKAEWERVSAELESGRAQYGSLPADFPLHLQRWQVMADSMQAEEAQSAALARQLHENRRETYQYKRFHEVISDFEARLGALVVLEDEAASKLAQANLTLGQVQSLSQARQETQEQLQTEFDKLSPDFADELRELQKVRQRLSQLQGELQPLDEQMEAELENRPVYLEWASMWPADFPARLKRWRSQQRAQQRELARRNWHQCERIECHRLCSALETQLAGLDNLHQQEEGFADRLLELVNARRQLKTESEAWQSLKERIDALEPVVRHGQERYTMPSDRYLELVDALRGRLWEFRQKQSTRGRHQAGREDLERQLAGAEETLQSDYADLRSAPVDFPARLREYFRLRQVEAELRNQETSLLQSQTRLERTLVERFSFLEHLGKELRSVVEEGRSRDETLYRLLVRLEQDISRRRTAEDRLTVVRHAMRGHRHFEQLPEGTLQILSLQAQEEHEEAEEPVAMPSPASVWADVERDRLHHLRELHGRLASELGDEATEMAAHYSDWRSWRDEAAQLEARLDVLPPLAESESLRTSLLALVATRLEESGLTIKAEDYLEYQTIKAEIARLAETRERLLAGRTGLSPVRPGGRAEARETGGGSDLNRIRAKLEELATLLGPSVTSARLHDSLARYEAVSVLRDTIHRLTSSLEALPSDDRLNAECDALQADMAKDMKRLSIADADDLEPAVARFQTYQTAVSSLAALTDMKKQRWPDAPETVVERLSERISSLEGSLGYWVSRVQSEDEVAVLKARWKLAHQIQTELQGVRDRLARVDSFAADSSESLEPELDVPDGDGDDELLLQAWEEFRQSEERMQGWREARASLLDPGSPGGGGGETRSGESLLDKLQQRLETLTEATRPFDGSTTPEAVIDLFEEDRRRRVDIDDIDQKLAGLPPEQDLLATGLELKERHLQRRSAIGLDPDEDVQAVLRDYRRFIQLDDERRTLLRLLAARDTAILDLRTRMDEMKPLIGLHDARRDNDASSDLAGWQAFQDAQARALTLQMRLTELGQQQALGVEARRALDERIAAVESRLEGLNVADILRDFPAYMKLRDELAPLQQRLSAPPGAVSLRRELREAISHLQQVVAPPPDLETRMEALRPPPEDADESPDGRLRERASEWLTDVSEGKLLRGTVDDHGRAWLWSSTRARTPAAEGPAWLPTVWQMVLYEELGDGYPWPLVFDDPDGVLEPGGKLWPHLQELARDRQIVVVAGAGAGEGMVADLDG